MPKYQWEPTAGVSGRYRDTETGRFIKSASVRAELDRYLDASDDAARALARALRNREVSLADWELGMRRLIKNTHLNAVALERGGWANMRPQDYGRAGQIIREQYGYLKQFGLGIASGKQRLDGTLDFRAKLYSQAGRETFYRSKQANLAPGIDMVRSIKHARDSCRDCEYLNGKWFKVGDPAYSLPGRRQCNKNCRCTEEYGRQTADGVVVVNEGGTKDSMGAQSPAPISEAEFDKALTDYRRELEAVNPLRDAILKSNPGMADDHVSMYIDAMTMSRDKFDKYAANLSLDNVESLKESVFERDQYISRMLARRRLELRAAGSLDNNTAQEILSFWKSAERQSMDIDSWKSYFRSGYQFDIDIRPGVNNPDIIARSLADLDVAIRSNPAAARVARDRLRVVTFGERAPGDSAVASWITEGGRINIPRIGGVHIDSSIWTHELGHGAEDDLPTEDIRNVFSRGRRASTYAWSNSSENFAETFMHLSSPAHRARLREWMPEQYDFMKQYVAGYEDL